MFEKAKKALGIWYVYRKFVNISDIRAYLVQYQWLEW